MEERNFISFCTRPKGVAFPLRVNAIDSEVPLPLQLDLDLSNHPELATIICMFYGESDVSKDTG